VKNICTVQTRRVCLQNIFTVCLQAEPYQCSLHIIYTELLHSMWAIVHQIFVHFL